MKKIAVITTSKELKEFQERTDIRILDINVKACDQTWTTQEYFVATIVYDDDLSSDPDYWTRLEHQYAGMAMQGMSEKYLKDYRDYCAGFGDMDKDEAKATMKDFADAMADVCYYFAHALVEKLK